MLTRILCPLHVALLLLAWTGLATADLDTLHQRFTTHLLTSESTAAAAEALASQGADGSWADIDYASTERTLWPSDLHLSRLVAMAVAWRQGGAAYQPAVVKGLEYWVVRNPTSQNKFTRRISAPMQLGKVLVLTKGAIPLALRDLVIDWSDDVIRPTGYSRYLTDSLEDGADACRGAYVHLCIAITRDQPSEVARAAGYIEAEAKFATPNNPHGLHPDFSYQYHGPQIYTPTYSSTHFEQTLLWARLFTGLPWMFTGDVPGFLRDGVLEGMQWMNRRGHWDPLVAGRNFALEGRSDAPIPWLADLPAYDPANAGRYQAFAAHLARQADGHLVGTRVFWQADYLAHRQPDFRLGLRMVSKRTSIQENGNDQNVLNLFLSQGATSILLDGDELSGLLPCWDFRRIPGTTAFSPTGKGSMTTPPWEQSGTTAFVGAASDGDGAVAAMDVDWSRSRKMQSEIYACKSWFIFRREMVCLGSGIRYQPAGTTEDPDFGPVATTVNQSLKRSDVLGPTGVLPTGAADQVLGNAPWLWHDRVGYFFSPGQDLRLNSNPSVAGDWKSISPGSYPAGKPATRPRVLITLDHGQRPEAAAYAYTVVPGVDAAAFAAWRAGAVPQVVANTPGLAAVWHPGERKGGLVVRDATAGAVQLRPGLSVQVDRPAILQVEDAAALRITLTNPLATGAVVVSVVRDGAALVATFDLAGLKPQTLVLGEGAPVSNSAPTVSAGPDLALTVGAGSVLQGVVADDGQPLGSSLSLQWAMVTGPGAAVFAQPSSASTAVAFPAVGTYVLRLSASDGVLSASDEVTVTVTGGDPVGDEWLLLAEADAYVRDGSYKSTCFGAAQGLEVKTLSQLGMTREILVRFVLPDAPMVGASLELAVDSLGTAGATTDLGIGLIADDQDAWDEATVCWSNRPQALSGAELVQRCPAGVGATWSLDLSAFAASTALEDPARIMTVRIRALTAGSKNHLGFASREHQTLPAPRLRIRTGAPGSVGCAVAPTCPRG